MSSCTTTTTTTAADQGGGTTTIAAIHSDIIRSHILNKLDGPTLASTSCASPQLLSLCNDPHLWKSICDSTWPSTTDPRVVSAVSAFPSGHRSLYNDSFPSLTTTAAAVTQNTISDTTELISAVDIFYDDELIHSKVLVTETLSTWFIGLPFRLDLLEPKETVTIPSRFPEDGGACTTRAEERLRVSWILIDPVNRRSMSVGSKKAVEARRHWLGEEDEVQLRYATVVGAGADGREPVQMAVVVTCGGGEMRVREVSMQVESMEGKIVNGMDSLVILNEAMRGKRGKSDCKTERDLYEMFVRMKERLRERKERREMGLDMMFIATGVSIFFAVIVFLLAR